MFIIYEKGRNNRYYNSFLTKRNLCFEVLTKCSFKDFASNIYNHIILGGVNYEKNMDKYNRSNYCNFDLIV